MIGVLLYPNFYSLDIGEHQKDINHVIMVNKTYSFKKGKAKVTSKTDAKPKNGVTSYTECFSSVSKRVTTRETARSI